MSRRAAAARARRDELGIQAEGPLRRRMGRLEEAWREMGREQS